MLYRSSSLKGNRSTPFPLLIFEIHLINSAGHYHSCIYIDTVAPLQATDLHDPVYIPSLHSARRTKIDASSECSCEGRKKRSEANRTRRLLLACMAQLIMLNLLKLVVRKCKIIKQAAPVYFNLVRVNQLSNSCASDAIK